MFFDLGIRTVSSLGMATVGAVCGYLATAVDPNTLQVTLTLPTILSLVGGLAGVLWWLYKDRQTVVDKIEEEHAAGVLRDERIANLQKSIDRDLLKGDRILQALEEMGKGD